ncbi:MAG: hypothetical protein LBQ15_11670 [Clostridium sp.]|nr:hypothetical protein [Clostridium sp.]
MKKNTNLAGLAFCLRPVIVDAAQTIADLRREDVERNKYIRRISPDPTDQVRWIERLAIPVHQTRLGGRAEALVNEVIAGQTLEMAAVSGAAAGGKTILQAVEAAWQPGKTK